MTDFDDLPEMATVNIGERIAERLNATEPEYGCDLSGVLSEKFNALSREAYALTVRAINEWSAQCNMTVEEWARWFEPVIDVVPGDGEATVKIVVSAKARDDLFKFEVTV